MLLVHIGMPREVGTESVVMRKAKQHLRFDLKHRSDGRPRMAGQAADSSKVLNKETHEGKAGLCEAVCSCSFIYQLSLALSEPWRGGQGGAAQGGRGRGRGPLRRV